MPPPEKGSGEVVVVDGGVMGLEAARVLALRGFEVTLFERELAAPCWQGVLSLGLAITCLEPLTGGASPLSPHRQLWGGAGLIPCHGCPRPTQ